MAGFIYIKRKKDPIEVTEDRARKIKLLRFGNDGENKADPEELIDLGDEWAGKLGEITAVEIKKDVPKTKPIDPDAERREWMRQELAKPIEERAKELALFKIAWWMRSGMKEKEVPKTVLEVAEQEALKWFTEHPNAPQLDTSVLEPILVKYWGTAKPKLGTQKRVVHSEHN